MRRRSSGKASITASTGSRAEHARLKRIREQIDVAGPRRGAGRRRRREDRRRAARADLHAGARRSRRVRRCSAATSRSGTTSASIGPAGMRRDFVAWALPREQVGDGTPWHIEGSLLGLDIALARLALRRIADNEMPVAPTINLNDQLTFARTVMTLNPHALRDADRDRIVAAIARGRERVAAAGANLPAVLALAEEAQLPACGAADAAVDDHAHARRWCRRCSGCATSCGSASPTCRRTTLDRWGVYAESLDNRLKTAMPTPSPWENFGGRADGGLIATQAPDLVAAAGGRNGPAEAAGAARPRPAHVCDPGLLARRRFPLPGRLAGDDATGTGAFAVAGRRLRGGAGRRRAVTPAVKGNLTPLYELTYSCRRGLTPSDACVQFMRTIGVLLVLTVALSAQEPQPRRNWRFASSSPEADSYVSGITKLKAEILPKMLATRVGADPVLRRRQAGVQRARSDRRRVRRGTPAPKCGRTRSASSPT